MRILLYSNAFHPAIGGVESVSRTLAEELHRLGHRVTVATQTPGDQRQDEGALAFSVVRRPSWRTKLRLVKDADVVHSNGASLALFFAAKALRRPFLWTHQGYQLVAVDGLGWVDGAAAPLRPASSILFHFRKYGAAVAIRKTVKLLIRRWAARHVDRNVAITSWVGRRQPLPRQCVIYNPFSLSRFASARRDVSAAFDLLFVGRLVSEKGVDVLLRALAIVRQSTPLAQTTLLVVGDGPCRPALQAQAAELGLTEAVTFAGMQDGRALLDSVERSRIAVVPSSWEEAMGGVALELLAAGKPLVVSRRGGLAECVGEAALLFENGDAHMLATQLRRLLEDSALCRSLVGAAGEVVRRFDERELVAQYVRVYEEVAR